MEKIKSYMSLALLALTLVSFGAQADIKMKVTGTGDSYIIENPGIYTIGCDGKTTASCELMCKS